MSENTTETRTVRDFRHEARRVLTQARESLALRTDATAEVYRLLNGSIESVLAGRQGLSQDEQVALLDEARSTCEANRENLTDAVEAARQQVIEQVKAWDFDAALAEALSVLTEAREFAATRDFSAHQERKHSRSFGFEGDTAPAFSDDEEDDPED